uniref:peptidylprolyl isomerase n=1 Tax=Haptolina brevifila TaxID=156173 RepID=A0A7S2CRY0_9EUKA|mmetsp:Transcript_28322/g.57102  ORF Transcript_28322/g.57102 Transcript_28322/m.57102 type:complete len:200 (+) Transcript_28322:16-615(+)
MLFATIAFAAAYVPLPAARIVRSVQQPRLLSRLVMAVGPVEVTDEWTTTPSGLSFVDIAQGSGEQPTTGSVVKVEYTGWLEASGTMFDSSSGRAPIAFAVGTGRVIPGWDEGVLSMRVGGKRRLSIPPELGYGDEGAGESIPGGSRLQFECELVSIESGFGAFISTFPGGLSNFVLITLLTASFIPYFLPENLKPTYWS